MPLLAIETTCDETAAAVIDRSRAVLSSVVASQDELHARWRGVVPELASRAHVERIVPVIDEALARSGIARAGIEAVAVAVRPGLVGSLLVGLSAAKGIAAVLRCPLIGYDHIAAHLYACRLAHGERMKYPPLRRARRQRRAYVAIPSPFAARSRAARWNDRRCRRRSLRQSGGAPRPRVSRWSRPRAGSSRWESSGPPLPAPAVDRSGAARRQFQRAEDGPPLPGQTPGRPRRHASAHRDRPRRPRSVFPAGRRRDNPRQGRSGPRPDRLPRPRGRGGSDGQQELARSPRAAREEAPRRCADSAARAVYRQRRHGRDRLGAAGTGRGRRPRA